MTMTKADEPTNSEMSAALRGVIVALAAAKPQKLTTTLQVRLPPDTAEALDALVARLNAASDHSVTRSDLVRAAVAVLVSEEQPPPA